MKAKSLILMALILCGLTIFITVQVVQLKNQEEYMENILSVDFDDYMKLYRASLALIDDIVSLSDEIIYLNYEAYEEINGFAYTDMDMEYVQSKFAQDPFYPKVAESLRLLDENILVLNDSMLLLDNPKFPNKYIKSLRELKSLASKIYKMASQASGSSVDYVNDYYSFKNKYLNKKHEVESLLNKK